LFGSNGRLLFGSTESWTVLITVHDDRLLLFELRISDDAEADTGGGSAAMAEGSVETGFAP